MALNLSGRTLRFALIGCCALLAACGREDRVDAEVSAAPIRQMVSGMLSRPNFKIAPGRCMCAGYKQSGSVQNFPAGVLDDLYARCPWLRRWSDCSEFDGQILSSVDCSHGATKYVCGVVDQPSVAKGARRVECRAYNDPLNGYAEGWDVSRTDLGKLIAKPTGLDWIE
jgi:hypothetical protein